MKAKHLLAYIVAVLVEGILVGIALLTMRFEAGRGHIINYAVMRAVLAGISFLFLIALLVLLIVLLRSPGSSQRLIAWLDGQLIRPKMRLFFIQGALITGTILLFEFFLLTYLAFPLPLRPLFLWGATACLTTWLLLRIVYAPSYQARPSLVSRLQSRWKGSLPVQRKVFTILTLIGLAYFIFFVPFNLLRNEWGKFYLLQDEEVIYPDVIKIFEPQASFGATVQNVLGSWNYQYGYPYLSISASVLVIPRLVFGNGFADQVQINIFLLRQFVSVLPMVLALLLAVYLVTRYKAVLVSVATFVCLMLVPGVVKINYRFWHPDSLILLIILLTIYFLEKDDLRFGKHFYLAALTCGLMTALKLWGLFFFLAIGGYLATGLIRHRISLTKGVLAGIFFILIMVGAIIVSSPSLLVPYVTRTAVASWTDQQAKILLGPERNDPTGYYQTTLPNWLKYFGQHFMKAYFFFFSVFALAAGSIWGSRKTLNRILLAWCLPVTLFLVYFSTMKSFQYMLMVGIPLYMGASLFPAITEDTTYPKWLAFLHKPQAGKIIRWITLAFFASQFIVNLVILVLFVQRGH